MSTTSSQLILLKHRSERFIAKDEMIQYSYSKQLTCLDKALGNSDVVCTGYEVSTGMVVSYDDRCRSLPERIAKYFFFRVPYETVIEITARDIPKGTPFAPFQRLQAIEKLVPKTVYDIEGWKIHSSEDLVIDVDVKSTTTGKLPIRNRYRLPIGYYRKRLSTEDSSVLIFQALDSNTSEALREEKMDLVFDLERVDRFWSESIFTHPWINAYGHLEFLNGASFAPSWIVHRGTLVAVLKSD